MGVQHVEPDEHDRDVLMAVEHPLAEPREAWFAVIAERDQLAIQGKALEVLRVVQIVSGRCRRASVQPEPHTQRIRLPVPGFVSQSAGVRAAPRLP
jgi:hypothetical protein